VHDRLQWSQTKWADVFDGGEREGRALVKLMCNRVRNGPRDLLRWIDLALQSTAGGKMSKDVADRTHKRLSLDSLNELVSAHNETYPRVGAVLKIIFRNNLDRRFALLELRKHIETLLLKDPELITLSKVPWMQRETSFTLPDLLFKIGAIALHMGQQVILPYEEGYHARNFESSSHVSVVPALVEALQ
jgi:hypothetical protein